MQLPQGYQIPRHQFRQQNPVGHQQLQVRQPHAFQPPPRRQWLFNDPNVFGYPVNMGAKPVLREDAQLRKLEKKAKKNKKEKRN